MGSGPVFRSTLEWITVVCAIVGTAVATWQGYLLSRTYLQPFQANRQLQQMDVCAEFVFRAAEFLASFQHAQSTYGKAVSTPNIGLGVDAIPQRVRLKLAEDHQQLDVATTRLKFYADEATVDDIRDLEIEQVALVAYLLPEDGEPSTEKLSTARGNFSEALEKVKADCKKVISGEVVGDI